MRLLISSLILALAAGLQAETLDRTVASLISNHSNLTLGAASARTEGAAAARDAENVLPSPEIGFDYMFGNAEVGNKWGLNVSQSFEWPGVYGARRRAGQATSRAEECLVEAQTLDLAMNLRQALVKAFYALKSLELAQNTLVTVDSLLTIARTSQARGGDVTRLDINRLEIERIAVSRSVGEARMELNEACAEVSQLCEGANVNDAVNRLSIDTPTPLRSVDFYLESQSNNPSIKYARLCAESAREEQKVARRSNLPGFTLGYAFENEAGEKRNGVTLGLSIPLWSRGSQRSARLEEMAAEMDAAAEEQRNASAIRSDYDRALLLASEIEQYTTALERDDNLQLLQRAYAAKQITLSDMLQQTMFFIEARQSLIDASMEYELTLCRLGRLTDFSAAVISR